MAELVRLHEVDGKWVEKESELCFIDKIIDKDFYLIDVIKEVIKEKSKVRYVEF